MNKFDDHITEYDYELMITAVENYGTFQDYNKVAEIMGIAPIDVKQLVMCHKYFNAGYITALKECENGDCYDPLNSVDVCGSKWAKRKGVK